MSPSLSYLKPLRNSNTFLHIIYKSKKKTNLLCILNNVFQYSKIRTRKQNAKKSIKTEKKFGIQPFLESGIHWAWIRNPVLGIRNPQGGIQNTGLSWNPLHGARCWTTHSQLELFLNVGNPLKLPLCSKKVMQATHLIIVQFMSLQSYPLKIIERYVDDSLYD